MKRALIRWPVTRAARSCKRAGADADSVLRCAVVCGEPTLAIFVQVIGSSCNVTTAQTMDAGRSKQGPRACSAGEIFPGKACTAMPGALSITVAPGANQKGLVRTEGEPDLQSFLSQLGIGSLQARTAAWLPPPCPRALDAVLCVCTCAFGHDSTACMSRCASCLQP